MHDLSHEYQTRIKKELYETETKGKATNKQKLALEAECRKLELEDRKE